MVKMSIGVIIPYKAIDERSYHLIYTITLQKRQKGT